MAVGIIAEYNPFHNGHAHQISEIKKIFPETEIIAVMSGNFTQRGEPAILDKFFRANLAVENGVDLVFELPFIFSVRSAENFARGGIKILKNLQVVDKIAFGAEISDLKILQNAAKINFSEIKSEMSQGISYAKAAEKILKIETKPNTILAIEYLRNLPKNIEPILIPRVGTDYHEKILQKISSASAIRAEIYKKNPDWEKISQSVEKNILEKLREEKNFGLVREELLFLPLLQKIFTSSPEEMQKIFGMNEGLENLIFKSAKTAKNFQDLISKIVNKRYQTSRIKRLFLNFLLGVEEIEEAEYLRILAFNECGRKILKKIAEKTKLPIIAKVTQHLTEKDFLRKNFDLAYKKNLSLDIAATNLRNILYEVPKNFGEEFKKSPKFCALRRKYLDVEF